MKSFAKYFSDLKTLMNKIDNIVYTEDDGELHDAFLTTFLKEEDAFSKGISVDDLADDFNQTLGASANSTHVKWKTSVEVTGDDVDNTLFKNTRTQQPEDSDDNEETIRTNLGASNSFYSEPQFSSHQGTYMPNATFPPNTPTSTTTKLGRLPATRLSTLPLSIPF
jgi:hypothetical protein